MFSRALVIIVGIPLVYAILAAGELSRTLMFAFLSLRGQFELFSMFDKEGPRHPFLEYAGSLLILVSALRYGEIGILYGLAGAVIFLAVAVVIRGLNGTGSKRFALGVSSLVYLPFCLSFFMLLAREKGFTELFAILAVIWSLDIGAFIAGSSLGGPKLAPQISPNKTISGAIGGMISCLITIGILFSLGFFQVPKGWLLLFGLLVGTIGQIADLFESVLKRESGVKDTGAIFGKHGGLLDRVDSVVFLGPLAYIFLVK